MNTERTIEMIRSFVWVVCGVLGLTLNLAYIDDLIMNHFTWFVVMDVIYIVMFTLGSIGLSSEEGDS